MKTVEYFKPYTGSYNCVRAYYCEGAECITCKHSYGVVNLSHESPDMMCKRLGDNCDYTPMSEVTLKKVVGKEHLGDGHYQVITER